MYWNEPLIDEYRTYCLAGSSVSSGRILVVTYVLACFDFLTAIGDFILLAYNRHQLKSEKHRFNLKRRFMVREMQISIRVIFPISIIHVIAFLPWPILYSIGKTPSGIEMAKFVEWASVFRAIYMAIVPLSFFMLQRLRSNQVGEWSKQTTEFQTNAYFVQLKRQFNNPRRSGMSI
ncbi:hypothetical protein M3Y98_00857800 [Aphelenchoides besseyi]|nr:hypothetical protein M3Y98_00857800 [Aphelenchoides besseyi]KAI6211147.1 hypothetical protein M3Y96_00402900 [Aphelenchoides besseyi]